MWWTEIGLVEELKGKPLQEVVCGNTKLALSYRDGTFAAISGICNHIGGPVGRGRLEVTCRLPLASLWDLTSATKRRKKARCHIPRPSDRACRGSH